MSLSSINTIHSINTNVKNKKIINTIIGYYNYSLGSSMLSGTSILNSAYSYTVYDCSTNLTNFNGSLGAYFYNNVYQNFPLTLGSTHHNLVLLSVIMLIIVNINVY